MMNPSTLIAFLVSACLHEVVLPVLASVLVAGGLEVLLAEQLVVGMVLLPLLLLALLRDAGVLLVLGCTSVSQR